MIYITKKKFDRIVKKLKNFIDHDHKTIMPECLVNILKKYEMWNYWSQNVRLNYYPYNYNIKIARERALLELIKNFKKELLL